MVTLHPIPEALVPVDSAAAQRISSPNYDEFQSNLEIFDLLQRRPDSVLRVTMPHACAASPEEMLAEGSPEALSAASDRMAALRSSSLTRQVSDVLFLYEIQDPDRPGVRQVGLGGFVPASGIVGDANPDGFIVRNEGVRPKKAQDRANLIAATSSVVGGVNMAVEDGEDRFRAGVTEAMDRRPCDFEATAEDGCVHRIALLQGRGDGDEVQRLLASESHAYVADGNHRSAAAALLGLESFLAIVFPASTMDLAPYNRLVACGVQRSLDEWRAALEPLFHVELAPAGADYQPEETHSLGFYAPGGWLRLVPRDDTFDPANAAEAIDAAIVQSSLFDQLLGIPDARDDRLTFVGGNRDAAYLRSRVDAGEQDFALTLPAVTMGQFVEVCRQRRMMPPKSTWFSPKIRSGLVMALLE